MKRHNVTFVNNTEEETSFQLYLKHVTGPKIYLEPNGGTHSEKITAQTHMKYVLYNSEGSDTGLSISSDNLEWKDNTVIVTKVHGQFRLETIPSTRSSIWTTAYNWIVRNKNSHPSASGLNETSNPNAPEANV